MQFRVTVDFFTDIITNSSSVVYSQADGVETMFAFLNDVIKEFGVDKKAEDVFNVSILPDMDRLIDWVDEEYEDEKFQDSIEGLTWVARIGLCETKAYELLKDDDFDFSDIYDDGYEESTYLITTKDNKDTGLGTKVADLFDHEAMYN